eukprot:gene7845-8656_t
MPGGPSSYHGKSFGSHPQVRHPNHQLHHDHQSDEEEAEEEEEAELNLSLTPITNRSSSISKQGLHHTAHKAHSASVPPAQQTITPAAPTAVSTSSFHVSWGLLMLVDGTGLAVITAATVLEGFELWTEIYDGHEVGNELASMLWLCGRISQIIGLLFLIGHASSFQVFPAIERFGMLMLTLGPMMNLSSYGIFRSAAHPSWIFNRGWLSSESLELLGIAVLDISLIDMEEIWVLIAEVTGFMLLCGAAGLHFEYINDYESVPSVSLRLDTTHASECFGLIVLTIVAVCQYRIKVHKHEQSALHNHAHHRNIPRHSDLV